MNNINSNRKSRTKDIFIEFAAISIISAIFLACAFQVNAADQRFTAAISPDWVNHYEHQSHDIPSVIYDEDNYSTDSGVNNEKAMLRAWQLISRKIQKKIQRAIAPVVTKADNALPGTAKVVAAQFHGGAKSKFFGRKVRLRSFVDYQGNHGLAYRVKVSSRF